MVAKRKTKPVPLLDFVAPFSLALCEKRLETKHQRRRPDAPVLGSFVSALEVYVDRKGPETRTFHVSRGSAVVKGRLDRIDSESTWVSATASINWFSQILVLLYVPLVLVGGVVLLLIGQVVASLFSIELAWLFYNLREFGVANPALLVGAALIYWFWRAFANRNALEREIVRTLTDQITDIPDLGEDEMLVGDDGELVPAPPMQSFKGIYRLQDSDELDELLKPKNKRDNSERQNPP